MKTNSKSMQLIILISFLLLTSLSHKAQCNYTAHNDLNCNIKVNITISTSSGGCTPSTCYSANGITIAAGAVFPIPCSGCTGVCDIEVTVIQMGGTNMGPVSAFFITTSPIFLSSLCGATNTIWYDAGNSQFEISY